MLHQSKCDALVNFINFADHFAVIADQSLLRHFDIDAPCCRHAEIEVFRGEQRRQTRCCVIFMNVAMIRAGANQLFDTGGDQRRHMLVTQHGALSQAATNKILSMRQHQTYAICCCELSQLHAQSLDAGDSWRLIRPAPTRQFRLVFWHQYQARPGHECGR